MKKKKNWKKKKLEKKKKNFLEKNEQKSEWEELCKLSELKKTGNVRGPINGRDVTVFYHKVNKKKIIKKLKKIKKK